jgi:hypothetical protein
VEKAVAVPLNALTDARHFGQIRSYSDDQGLPLRLTERSPAFLLCRRDALARFCA